jgi:hypothetical protein
MVLVSLASQLRLVGFCISTSSRKRNQILVRQLVIVWPNRRWIGGELVGTQKWSILDAHVVLQKQCHISGYNQPYIGLALFNAIELVRTCVVVLVETYVSQLHNRPPFQAGVVKRRSALHDAVAVAAFWAGAFGAAFPTAFAFFPPAFRASHRLRVASPILFLAAALIFRCFGAAGFAALLPDA